jgi:hypothetical protein
VTRYGRSRNAALRCIAQPGGSKLADAHHLRLPSRRGKELVRDSNVAEQIGTAVRLPLRKLLALMTVTAALVPVGWGLTHSEIVTDIRWNDTMLRQAMLLAGLAAGSTLVAVSAERLLRLRLEIGLALAGAIVVVVAFGPLPAAVVAIFLMSATVVGIGLGRMLGGRADQPLVLLTAFGAAAYSVLFTLLSPIPVNTVAVHAALLALPLLIACASPQLRGETLARVRGLQWLSAPPPRRSLSELLAFALLLFVAALHTVLAALPERYWDAMVLHLYLPSFVQGNGAWNYDATFAVFALLPAGVDWMYTHFFLLAGEPGARLYNLAAFLLLCAVCYLTVSRLATPRAAAWMVVLFASMPIAFLESATLFVEHTLALWVAAAAAIIIAADLRPDLRQLVAVLTILAAASTSKLHGALAATVIGPAALGLYLRQRPPARDLIRAFGFCVALGAVACFPYTLSWIKSGNPFHPFYNDIFKSELFPPVAFRDTRWMGRFDWTLLYDATFFSGNYLEAAPGALGLTAIVLVPLALIGAVLLPAPAALASLAFAALIFLPIAAQIQYLRYFYPILPLLLAPAGLTFALLTTGPLLRALMCALLTAVVVFNIYKIPSAGWLLNNLDLGSAFDSDKRRQLELQAPERLANRQINATAGAAARVLYTGNPYGGLLQGVALYNAWYNVKLSAEMRAATAADQVAPLLERWRVTHVVHSMDGSNPGQQVVGAYLASKYQPVAEFGRIKLYDLRSPAGN